MTQTVWCRVLIWPSIIKTLNFLYLPLIVSHFRIAAMLFTMMTGLYLHVWVLSLFCSMHCISTTIHVFVITCTSTCAQVDLKKLGIMDYGELESGQLADCANDKLELFFPDKVFKCSVPNIQDSSLFLPHLQMYWLIFILLLQLFSQYPMSALLTINLWLTAASPYMYSSLAHGCSPQTFIL